MNPRMISGHPPRTSTSPSWHALKSAQEEHLWKSAHLLRSATRCRLQVDALILIRLEISWNLVHLLQQVTQHDCVPAFKFKSIHFSRHRPLSRRHRTRNLRRERDVENVGCEAQIHSYSIIIPLKIGS